MRITATKVLADFFHAVRRNRRARRCLPPRAGLARGRCEPLVQNGAELARDIRETHAAASAVFVEPLNFANTREPVRSVEGKGKRDQPVGVQRAHGTEAEALFRDAEQHAAVSRTELEVHKLVRCSSRERFWAYFHGSILNRRASAGYSILTRNSGGRTLWVFLCTRQQRDFAQPAAEVRPL